MALKTAKTALAIALQVGGAGAFANPTSADIYPISQARLDIQGQTLDNDEYLGQIFRNAPDIAGKRVTLGFNVKLRAECPNIRWFMSLDDARVKMEDWR